MTLGPRPRVTRGYVGTVLFATVVIAAALLIAGWGILSLMLDRGPVTSEHVSMATAPVLIAVLLGIFAWSLWRQALTLLRGRKAPSWGVMISVSLGAYLLWCVGGLIAGMSIDETWASPFAALLAPIWFVAALFFWAVLARRVYTDRPTPKWPWERTEEDG